MVDKITNIEQLILEELLPGSGRAKIDSDESLFSSGFLDSLTLLRFVVMLEQQFGITVNDGELIPDNFETISKINTFLESKRKSCLIGS